MRIMVNHDSHLIILTRLAIAMNSIKLWLPLCLLMTDNQYFKDKHSNRTYNTMTAFLVMHSSNESIKKFCNHLVADDIIEIASK